MILSTEDGGETWLEPAYRRYPAPWSWLAATLLVSGTIVVARKKPRERKGEQPSVADLLASDRPLERGDTDVLGFETLTSGVVRFLANEKTDPPLTLAVTGEWGSGKSSMMNLIRDGLGDYGFRTIWFNAWHHQTEEHLLAALNEALKSGGTPPWWSLEGLGFRARLLFRRGWHNWVPVALFVILLSALASFLAGGDRYASALDGLRRAMHLQAPASLPQGGSVIALLFTLVAPLFAILRGLSTFASSTTGIGSRLLGRLRIDSGGMAPGLRQRFAKHFRDVTEALAPRRLVLFIDDLDRCQPENVVRVLELVSFLVSSGKCYVVLGIAPEWVASAVGLGFKEVADEWASLQGTRPTSDGKKATVPTPAAGAGAPAQPDANGSVRGEPVVSAPEKRREFALKYLSKLVNIEIPVPPISQDQAKELLAALADEEAPAVRRARKNQDASPARVWARRLVPFAPLAFFSALGALALLVPGAFVALFPPVETPPVVVAADPPIRLDLPTQGTPAPDKPETESRTGRSSSESAAPKDSDRSGPVYEPGSMHELPLLPVLLLVALLLIWSAYELSRARLPLEQDSPDFRMALEHWAPVVYRANPSPRSVKRFLNRVRYMAMCQRAPLEKATRWQRMKTLARLQRKGAGVIDPAAKPQHAIPESDLVALAALHHAFPKDFESEDVWKGIGTFMERKNTQPPGFSEDPKSAFARVNSLRRHRAAFEALSKGISIHV